MKTFTLKGEIRMVSVKSSLSRRELDSLRWYGGHGGENINFVVKTGDVRNLIYTPGCFTGKSILEKRSDGNCKDVQFHPVKIPFCISTSCMYLKTCQW